MDKRDLGILMILGSYIFLAVRTAMFYLDGVTDPLALYRYVGSDPIIFLVNLGLYLVGAYLLVGYASQDVRDMLINIIFFGIPFLTLLFIVAYLWVTGGPKGLLLLYGTAQFPLYHISLMIVVGIIAVLQRRDVDMRRLTYAVPFILIIVGYAIIRVTVGIVAFIVIGFLILAGILTIILTKKLYE